MKGRNAKFEIRNARSNLTKLKKEVIIRYIIDLNSREFSPRIINIKNIISFLFRKRGAKFVEINWPNRFILRVPKLKTYFNRIYNY